MKKLSELIGELDNCVKCGSCRSGCPTFTALHREGASARGRLTVIGAHAGGEVGFSESFKRHVKDCALCGTCYAGCPNDVNTPLIVLAARAESVEKEGLPFGTAFFLKNVLDSNSLGPMAMKIASKLQGFKIGRGSKSGTADVSRTGLISRFLMPYLGEGRPMPELANPFFLDSPEVKTLEPKTTANIKNIAYFAGCGVNYMLAGIGTTSLQVLDKAGANIIVPEAQICCGMPALSMGDVETAKSLAIKNLDAFESSDIDFITTSCATCSYALKNVFMEVLEDEGPEMRARVERFASKVRDITELLEDEFEIKPKKKLSVAEGGGVVTYHDPCHLSRGQGIKDAPRDLLGKSAFTFKELNNPCKCCGLGGGLGYTNIDLSMKIAGEKARKIIESEADVVATACPGCMIQIKDGLEKLGSKIRVAHIVELI